MKSNGMIRTSLEEVNEVNRLGELPDGWKWIPLGLLCEKIIGGGTPDRKNPSYWGGDIPWASVKDLKHDELITTEESITLQGLENSSTKIVEPGTVVVATRISLGKVSIARNRIAINQDLKGLVLVPNVLEKYLTYNLKSRALEIERQGSGATVKGIKLEELKLLRIPIPFPNNPALSRDIQHCIVSRIDSLLAELKGDRQLVEEMWRDADRIISAVLDEVFTKLSSQYQPELLKRNISHLTSGSRGWSKYASTNNDGPLFIRVGNVGFSHINLIEIEKLNLPSDVGEERARVNPGDVLVTITGTIGRCCVVSEGIGIAYISQHVALIRLKDRLDPHYLMWFILAPSGGGAQTKVMQYGQTKPGLNLTNIRNLSLPIPEKTVQRQIVAYVDSIQQEVEQMLQTMEQDSRLLDRLEQSILEKAFQGQL